MYPCHYELWSPFDGSVIYPWFDRFELSYDAVADSYRFSTTIHMVWWNFCFGII